MTHFNIRLSLFICLLIIMGKVSAQRPNIILVMTDDQGWYDAGFNGNAEIKTPHLDQLAANGIIFDRFYAASAVCSPTRASVITGRNPLRMNIPTANRGHMLDAEITLPEILREQGYTTGHFGKWHLGTLTRSELDANRGGKAEFSNDYSIPTMHGYQNFFCTESKVPTFDPMVYPAFFENGESLRYGWKALTDNRTSQPYGTAYWKGAEEKVTENLNGDNSKIIMDRAIPFMEKSVKENQPFFTTIWLHTPHLPVVGDSLHRSYYGTMDLQKQLYYGTITAMDDQIGRLWSTLEALDIEEDTILWFCSDNGPENGTPGSTKEFRERKRSLYEGGVRVPAFVIWKNHLKSGTRTDFPAVTSDYLPTLLDILKIEYPDDRPVDGESIWEAIQGIKKQREKAIGFLFGQKISWVDNHYKLISTDKGTTFELYNLIADRAERVNRIRAEPKIAAKMKKELSTWLNSVENSKKGVDYN